MTVSSLSLRSLRRTRRLAPVAAAVVLTMSACGASDEASSSTSSSATVPGPSVIQIAAGSGGGRSGAPAEEATADAMTPAMSSRIAFIEYSFEGDLPNFDGPAPSWFFEPGQEPSAERVQAMAAALGVAGELEPLSAEMGGGWVVGPSDGSAPALMVSKSSLLDWWYSPGPLADSTSVGCASAGFDPTVDTAMAPDGAVTPTVAPCPEPEPPVGVPSEDEARAAATELFGSLGYDVSQYELEVYADEWSASVTAWLLLDGRRSPVSMNVGFGADGAVTWVSGILAEPQRGGDYPRIGTAAAFERLQEQGTGWSTFGDVAARETESATGAAEPAPAPATEPAVDPATDRRSATEPATEPAVDPGAGGDVTKPLPCPEPLSAADAATSSEAATDPATDAAQPVDATAETLVAPVPLDCIIEETATEPLLVTLNGVREDLTMIWAVDDTVWLLPAYTFTSADGGLYTVNAVADEFLAPADPVPPEELVDPVDDTASVPVAPEPGTDQTAPTVVVDELTASWVGSPLADVERLAAEMGLTVRVVRQDGQDLPATADLRTDRVNVAVETDIVTEVISVG